VTPALWTLIAVLVAVGLSMVSRVNVGLVALAFAWIVGVYVADLKPDAVMSGFPATLFLTLVGVTLLFAIAEANGTLETLAKRAVRLVRGNAALVPVLLFVIAAVLSSVGAGAVSAVALIIPLGMVIGTRAGSPYFLTALMVCNGANAGNMSPVSPVGVIANTIMAKGGMVGHELMVWFANFAAHAIVAAVAYFLLKGYALRGSAPESIPEATLPLSGRQRFTTLMIGLWIVGVVILKINPGLSAFATAVLLIVLLREDEGAALKRVPWGVIMLLSGVSVLIALLEKTGGMDLFTGLLARLATPDSVNGVIAFVTGVISTYSSTSGVVLPAFLPTVSGLVNTLGGGDPLAVALSINVGSSLVDVSPLSTLGALCVAAVADPNASRALFRRMLVWGLSMTVVGALLCQLFAGALARM
jgi:di/tricarboxylate transporter